MPIQMSTKESPTYCANLKEEVDGNPCSMISSAASKINNIRRMLQTMTKRLEGEY
ncbi:hypothetical protein PTKIN_Ptkin04bG0095500 [Pterospermum kingtungense]